VIDFTVGVKKLLQIQKQAISRPQPRASLAFSLPARSAAETEQNREREGHVSNLNSRTPFTRNTQSQLLGVTERGVLPFELTLFV